MDKPPSSTDYNTGELQNDVIFLRQEVPKKYSKYLKKEAEILVNNLLKAEFTIPINNDGKINDIDTSFLKCIRNNVEFPIDINNSATNLLKGIDNL